MAKYFYSGRSRSRITQAESSLLDSMFKQVMVKGGSATSGDAITPEAGFSLGAARSNFSSKNEMFLELLKRMKEEDLVELNSFTISQFHQSAEMALLTHVLAMFHTIRRNGAGDPAEMSLRPQ